MRLGGKEKRTSQKYPKVLEVVIYIAESPSGSGADMDVKPKKGRAK